MTIAQRALIQDILHRFKNIAVVGLSPEAERPSHYVSEYMISKGFNIVGIRPHFKGQILQCPIYNSLQDIPGPLEIVNVFRQSSAVPEIVDEAIRLKAKVLWLQDGVSHPEAEERAETAGIVVISNDCIMRRAREFL